MIGWIILAAVLVWVAILLIRAAACKPVEPDYGPDIAVDVDGEAVTERLAQLVRIPTVSNYDESKVDFSQFEQFRAELKRLYPQVHQTLSLIHI